MIRHIVLWNFKEFAEGNEKQVNFEVVSNRLTALSKKLRTIKSIKLVKNVINGQYSYDFGLIMDFESIADLEAYKIHPEHVEISRFVAKVRNERATIDFEL